MTGDMAMVYCMKVAVSEIRNWKKKPRGISETPRVFMTYLQPFPRISTFPKKNSGSETPPEYAEAHRHYPHISKSKRGPEPPVDSEPRLTCKNH